MPGKADPKYIAIVLQWLYKARGPFQVAFHKLTSNVIAFCIHVGEGISSGDSCFAERTKENIGNGYLFEMFNGFVPNKFDSNILSNVEGLQISSTPVSQVANQRLQDCFSGKGTYVSIPMKAAQLTSRGVGIRAVTQAIHPGLSESNSQEHSTATVSCMQAKLRNMRPTPVSSTDCQFTSRPRRLRQEW